MPKDDIINLISSACRIAERLQPHGLGGEGEALPPLLLVALDSAVSLDLVGDNLDLTVDGLAIVGDTLDPDNDNGSHDRLLSLPRGDCRLLSVWRAKLRVISYITRDEVSTAKEV